MLQRKIIHIDMDAFFASVEQRDHPELRGKPIAVGGGGRRGVVAAASYEARAFGVKSAMPGFKARELCPQLIFVNSNYQAYKEASQEIRKIFEEYTDLIEPLSLDEAFLDVTDNKVGNPSASLIAKEIRKKIKEKTQLNASAGISINKFLAKVASDLNKPNGQAVIPPEKALQFLEELEINKFFGIGKATTEKMHRLGIRKGKDLKAKSKIELAQLFGKSGIWYYHIVRAEDYRPVKPNRIRKSIGAERTFFKNLMTIDEMLNAILPITEKVYERMEVTGRKGRTLTLKIKYKDFTSITRSISFPHEIDSLSFLQEESESLLRQNLQNGDEIRLLGLTISNLTGIFKEGQQLEIQFPNVIKGI